MEFELSTDGSYWQEAVSLPPSMAMPPPSAAALDAAQQGAKLSFELAPDGASWVEAVVEPLLPGVHRKAQLPGASRLPPPPLPDMAAAAFQAFATNAKVELELSADGSSWVQTIVRSEQPEASADTPTQEGVGEAPEEVSEAAPIVSRWLGLHKKSARMPAARRFPTPSPEAVAAAQRGGQVVFELAPNGSWVEVITPGAEEEASGVDAATSSQQMSSTVEGGGCPPSASSPSDHGRSTRCRWDLASAAMPDVKPFPRPSPEAVAAAERGRRVEFKLAADGMSWEACEVEAPKPRKVAPRPAAPPPKPPEGPMERELRRAASINLELTAEGMLAAAAIDLGETAPALEPPPPEDKEEEEEEEEEE